MIATALFVIVIRAVATDRRAAWYGGLAPIAIGGFIFTAATVIGPFTSGSFNLARSVAPALLDASFTDLWVFCAAPLTGGVIGGLLYWLIGTNMGNVTEGEEITA